MITYKEFGNSFVEQVMSIYHDEGWTVYSESEAAKVMRAFDKSLFILGAFEQEKLLGFIRCTGDGEFNVYVTDLIVDKSYRKQGIGKTLFKMAMERFKNIENFTLMTGLKGKENNTFYCSAGMTEFKEYGLVGYIR